MKQLNQTVMDDTSPLPHKSTPSRAESWRMFDRIAHRYDLLNHLLSLRRDVVWRNRVAGYLPQGSDLKVLDVATGTADLLLALFNKSQRVRVGVGVDMSLQMLRLAQRKVASGELEGKTSLIRADADKLPFAERSFDAVTIGFGIRNVPDVFQTLSEMHRVLKAGGKVLILEFSLPRNRLMRRLYPFHLRGIIPRVGALISGDSYAYRYLNETVETFPYGDQFCELMQQAGFVEVNAVPLTFGVATIYHGRRTEQYV